MGSTRHDLTWQQIDIDSPLLVAVIVANRQSQLVTWLDETQSLKGRATNQVYTWITINSHIHHQPGKITVLSVHYPTSLSPMVLVTRRQSCILAQSIDSIVHQSFCIFYWAFKQQSHNCAYYVSQLQLPLYLNLQTCVIWDSFQQH